MIGEVGEVIDIIKKHGDIKYVIAFSKHKNRTMYFDFGHKH